MSNLSPLCPTFHPYVQPFTLMSNLSPLCPTFHPYVQPFTLMSNLSPLCPTFHPCIQPFNLMSKLSTLCPNFQPYVQPFNLMSNLSPLCPTFHPYVQPFTPMSNLSPLHSPHLILICPTLSHFLYSTFSIPFSNPLPVPQPLYPIHLPHSQAYPFRTRTSSLEAQVNLGGEGLTPFYNLLPGGRHGNFYKEMEDFFYYSQIRTSVVLL